MLKSLRLHTFIILFSALALAITFTVPGKAESTGFPIGSIAGIGKAEYESAPGKMTFIGNNTSPLFTDSRLKTYDGRISVTFRNNGRIEIYKDSELIINLDEGVYYISHGRGSIAFSLPSGIPFKILTPSASIEIGPFPSKIQKVSYTKEPATVKGTVTVDMYGNTQVTSVNGEMAVKDFKGNPFIIYSGRSLSLTNEQYKFTHVQALLNEKGTGTDRDVITNNDLSCPTTGIVGEEAACRATEKGHSCENCDMALTAPDGKTFSGKTDLNGNFRVNLTLEGIYKVSLLKNGIMERTIKAERRDRLVPYIVFGGVALGSSYIMIDARRGKEKGRVASSFLP